MTTAPPLVSVLVMRSITCSWIGDVMEGGARDDCVDLRRKFGTLELDSPVVRLLGCLRVDANCVVAFGAQHRHEAAE